MGWKKRPSNIKNYGESVLIPLHIGIVAEDVDDRNKALKDEGMERPVRITFDDL